MITSTTSMRRALPRFAIAQPKEKIRIGVPTKTYWPTIVCETALRQKLFEKEGLDCELTIYRGGAEGFEAIAAGAADLILNSSSSVAAASLISPTNRRHSPRLFSAKPSSAR